MSSKCPSEDPPRALRTHHQWEIAPWSDLRRPSPRHGLSALKGALARIEEGQNWTETLLWPEGVALRARQADLIGGSRAAGTVTWRGP